MKKEGGIECHKKRRRKRERGRGKEGERERERLTATPRAPVSKVKARLTAKETRDEPVEA